MVCIVNSDVRPESEDHIFQSQDKTLVLKPHPWLLVTDAEQRCSCDDLPGMANPGMGALDDCPIDQKGLVMAAILM